MGRKCSVEGCLSESIRSEDVGVTFHRVPMHSDVRPKWLSLCRIPESKATKVIHICSRHFLRADFCNFKGKKYLLRQGVLPSVFPWDKSKLEAMKAEGKKEKATGDEIKTESPDDSPPSPPSDKSNNTPPIDEEKTEVKIEPKTEETNGSTSENPQQTQTTNPPATSTSPINFTINSRLEAVDFNGQWFPVKIVEVDYEDNEVLLHFENLPTKNDEWISMHSSRLRPLQTPVEEPPVAQPTPPPPAPPPPVAPVVEQFTVGERCMAQCTDGRSFPATIMNVMKNGSYEVLFDDGIVKILKGHFISKMAESEASLEFEPLQKSKQGRKERKRKLNVAELFNKRPRVESGEKSQKKSSSAATVTNVAEQKQNAKAEVKTASEEDTSNKNKDASEDASQWTIQWQNGKPVGTESTINTMDGPRSSYIIHDPKIPQGWTKHLLQRKQGICPGKWDAIIVSPEGKKFRTRADLKRFLDEHPSEGIDLHLFDFATSHNRKGRKIVKPPEIEPLPPVLTPTQEEVEALKEPEEDSSKFLKILYEDDSYKCPIDGCGKNFRRENLALMHVKHYHPEYTKYLDSTPNVADLAYARTVGEHLERSPVSTRPSAKSAGKSSVTKSKQVETPDQKQVAKPSSPKHKDSEIIKLLNSKLGDKKDSDNVQDSSTYPEIKLKDLLAKPEGQSRKGDTTRVSTGIKTLLPVRQPSAAGGTRGVQDDSSKQGKRKRDLLETEEVVKGKDQFQQQIQPSTPQTPPTALSPLDSTDPNNTSQNPSLPPNNIIIEGGEVIRIVRMRQEEIINCTCGFMEEDGLMIQCELCLCWQHAYCNNIERESQVPEKYICFICQNPTKERLSRKYYHDQEWLKQGTLPVGSYHAKDNELLHNRFEKLRKSHDVSGGLVELRDYMHSLEVKLKIADSKNHPKLYLWSKPWPKSSLPEKPKVEIEDIKPKEECSENLTKDVIEDKNSDLLMMLLKDASKESISKLNLPSLIDNNISSGPIIPRPEAAIDLADCRLNLLEHIAHQESLVEERLDEFERQLETLEEGMKLETHPHYPKTRMALQMVLKDMERLKGFTQHPYF